MLLSGAGICWSFARPCLHRRLWNHHHEDDAGKAEGHSAPLSRGGRRTAAPAGPAESATAAAARLASRPPARWRASVWSPAARTRFHVSQSARQAML